MPELSVIIPVLNEFETIDMLMERLQPSINHITPNYEIIFIDDGSTDGTIEKLKGYAHQDRNIKIISFSRNFGHQAAILAGMQYCEGKYVVIMDGDLQDPPELIEKMYQKANQGFDVIFAKRTKRHEIWWKKVSYWTFYRILSFLTQTSIPLDSGDFCLMNKKVVKAINNLSEKCRFQRGLRAWVGFKQTSIAFERETREFGNPKYNLQKLFKLAFDGIFTMSEVPLRLSTLVGGFLSLCAFVWGSIIIVWKFNNPGSHVGFASLAVSIGFFSGVQLIFLGIIGEYIARIHMEVKNRPMYITNELVNIYSDTKKSVA